MPVVERRQQVFKMMVISEDKGAYPSLTLAFPIFPGSTNKYL